MQLFLIAVIGVVLFILITWHEVRRLRILADAERQRTERENALWKIREARDKIDVSLLQRMENAVGALRSLIEEQKRYTWEAAKRAAAVPTLSKMAMDANTAAFDAAGIYHDRQGAPKAGASFPWGTKAIDPRAVGAGWSNRQLDEIEAAAAHQRAIDAAWTDAHLHGVGAFRAYYDIGELPSAQHVPAAAFMGSGGGSFDGGGASGDWDRSTSPASTSSASDTCSSSSSYSSPSSSDSGSSSCSSSDSGGSSSSSSD